MTKSELISKIASKNPNLYLKEVEQIVNVIFDKIIEALAQGDRVELRGFGTFSVRTRTPREAKNPRTGEKVSVQERRALHFKLGKELYDMINE